MLFKPARAWGTRFDSLPSLSSPPTSPERERVSPVAKNASDGDERTPHDASIFVGSLPANIEHSQLAQLLANHLSKHAEIASVKVVRDSKGGACAFVQCQNAGAAAALLETLNSAEPTQFFGRILRYEAARAFRTLLISYRTPTQLVNAANTDINVGTEDYPPKTAAVELDLPSVMRIWKRSKTYKHPSILYNDDATEAKRRADEMEQTSAVGHAFHLEPVVFTVEVLRALVEYFGPITEFKNYVPSDDNHQSDTQVTFPYPHNGSRKQEQDQGCYEVKWAQRDDCVAALMTLRRVPHLTVTWAHQKSGNAPTRPMEYHDPRSAAHHNVASYPFYAAHHSLHERTSTRSAPRSFEQPNKPSNHTNAVEEWRSHHLETSQSLPDFGKLSLSGEHTADWSETEFPPLSDRWGHQGGENGVTADGRSHREGGAIVLSHNGHVSTSHEGSRSFENGHDYDQELSVPPTPGLAMSPITPRTPSHQFPKTPTSANSGNFAIHSGDAYDGIERSYVSDESRLEKDLDPTTIFVGGLEMYGPSAWDENKVSAFFMRYGELENVRIVRPLNGKAAFAFVTFNNTDAPARAVAEEHNRIVEGRAIRVQLRDCNHARSNWKHRRPRFSHHFTPGTYQKTVETPVTLDTIHIHPSNLHVFDTSNEYSADMDISATTTHEVVPEGDQIDQSHTHRTSRPPSPVPPTTHHAELEPAYGNDVHPAVHTPPLPLYGSATYPFPGAPYPVAPGFYTSPPWMHPYSQQIPYPVPYYPGYPGYGVAQPTAHLTPSYTGSGGGSDSGVAPSTASAPQQVWPNMAHMSMYGAFIPYPGFPNRLPYFDQPSPSGQPPVVPSGFIQNEQGGLVAVYPPDALDHYMTGHNTAASTPPFVPNAAYHQNAPVVWHPPTQAVNVAVPPAMHRDPPRLHAPPRQHLQSHVHVPNNNVNPGVHVISGSVSLGHVGQNGQGYGRHQDECPPGSYNKRSRQGPPRAGGFNRGNGRRGRGGGHSPNFGTHPTMEQHLRPGPHSIPTAISAPHAEWAQWAAASPSQN